MNTKQIDCVLELSQTLNFNRAAQNLFMSQPSLSYQIRAVEDEAGFAIFVRSGRGAVLTPAGAQFCIALRSIRDDLKRAVEMGQNFGSRYAEALHIGLPDRASLAALPRAIRKFGELHPDVSVTPVFDPTGSPDAFLRGEQDAFFTLEERVRRAADVTVHPLYDSRIYLITLRNDPLARKELVTMDDLRERTLMVGGGSPTALRAIQHRVVSALGIDHFNSADHDTTLVNVLAGRGVCLAPGMLNSGSDDVAWTPFDCPETISCVLCTHASDKRGSTLDLVRILQDSYAAGSRFARTV
ncbi:LysR family transcriptional regulator [uncultured Propionibacterium sp.]|uniref:LysR family transcriptional regulator n=1 Tax=uncultured Propionibacterium sp. TaxID=218066 RepID=UPI00292D4F8A|nr:LysR family transcriptional regulator [uncultured Propionibacterium sp.]